MSARISLRKSLVDVVLAAFGGRSIRPLRRSATLEQNFVESCEQRVLLSATDFIPGRVMFQMQPGQSVDVVQANFPSAAIRPIGTYGLYLMTQNLLTQKFTADTRGLVDSVASVNGVTFAEPDWLGQIDTTPNDTDYTRLWGLQNTGQVVQGTAGVADADIDADLAWNVTTGLQSNIVAVIDTGIDYLHEDLAANMWQNSGETAGNGIDDDGNGYVDDVYGYDFGAGDSDPMDTTGHGTHCAGTIGAVGDNSLGVAGVNWHVSLMALRVEVGVGGIAASAVVEAINYATAMGASVSNHSYGFTTPPAGVQAAIRQAGLQNHIIVAAAGNNAGDNDVSPRYPAAPGRDSTGPWPGRPGWASSRK